MCSTHWPKMEERLIFHILSLLLWLCHEVKWSRVWLCDPWTVAYHAPLSMGSSSQEYWSGLPFPSPEDIPDPGIEPRYPSLWADALPSEPPGKSCLCKYPSIFFLALKPKVQLLLANEQPVKEESKQASHVLWLKAKASCYILNVITKALPQAIYYKTSLTHITVCTLDFIYLFF